MLVAITVSWQQDSRLAKVKQQHLAPGENGGNSWWEPISLESIPIKNCFFGKPKQFLIGFFVAFESCLFVCLFFSGAPNGEVCTSWHVRSRKQLMRGSTGKKWPKLFMGLPGVNYYFTLLI